MSNRPLLLQVALAYASGELTGTPVPVFPCRGKIPATPNGWKDETTDADQIKVWFALDYNLALRPVHLGCVVIDADLGHDPRDLAGLPKTYAVRTPSGGHHFYFATNLQFGNRRWAPKIDTRSAAGYVLIPPCEGYEVVDERDPADLPDWAAAKLARADVQAEPLEAVDPIRLRHTLARIDPGRYPSYDEWAGMLAAVAGAGGDGGLALDWSSGRLGNWPCPDNYCGDNFDMEAKLATFRGEPGSGKPAGFGTIMQAAASTPEPVQLHNPGEVFPWHDPIDDYELPELTYFDPERMMPRVPGGAVMLVVGRTGNHKTGLVMSKCLASGARTLYIATEGAHGIRKTRLRSYQRALKLSDQQIRDRWKLVPERFNLFDASAVDLVAAYKRWQPEIVVIDVMARAIDGDLNDAQTAQGVIKRAERLSADFDGALVVMLAHPSLNGKERMSGNTLFGSLTYAELWVEKCDGGISCKVVKMKDGPADFTMIYTVQAGNPPLILPDAIAPEELERREVKAKGPDPLFLAVQAIMMGQTEIIASIPTMVEFINSSGLIHTDRWVLGAACRAGTLHPYAVNRGGEGRTARWDFVPSAVR